MLIQKITEEELKFMELWHCPRAMVECLFADLDNFGRFSKDRFSSLRLYQLPMLSDEPLIDFKTTAKYHNLNEKEEFQLRKNIGDVYNLGARLYGKSLISLKLDIVLSALFDDGLQSAFYSIDEKRMRGILDSVKQAFEYHPIFKAFNVKCMYKPEIKFYGQRNHWSLKGINMTLKGKSPGEQFYQLHANKLWGDEVSFETEEVFKKRRDSVGELGCIFRLAGMTNFTRHSPMGRIFRDSSNRKHIVNLPRYANPRWTQKDKEDALKQYGGKESLNYKIFVEGEIIEDGITEFQPDRIEHCYKTKSTIKRFELKKEQFRNFRNLIVVQRPQNAERIFIAADIGDGAGGTDIIILSEVNGKYNYLYNITAYHFIYEEQLELFKWLISELEAEIIGIDCGEALGRSLSDALEKLYSKGNVVRYHGNEKVNVGLEKDETGKVVTRKGEVIYRQEYMKEWSVNRLKVILYEGLISIPMDYKFQNQIESVVSRMSGTRTLYDCPSETGDHLFAAFRVFAICDWQKKAFNQIPKMAIKPSIGVCSWTRKEKIRR